MNDSDRSHGYVTDTSYTDSFFRELSPTWLNYVAVINGVVPRGLDRPFTYMELGCGFGGSTVVNAGAFPRGEFHACDLNPDHVQGGRRHAAAFGVDNIQFHQASFHDLRPTDLPAFDFIVLHGVYSWVDAESRRAIQRFIQGAIKPGGLVYLSYNCLPGWSVEVPLRRLLVELAAAEGGSPARVEQALRSLRHLSHTKLRYFSVNPSAADAVDSYAKGSSNYIAHEFLNQSWEPFYSIDVADELAPAGLRYVGSATLPDNHPTLVVDAAAADAVAALPTARQRQLAVDFAVNQRFRRDVFVSGGADSGPADTADQLRATPIGCVGSPERLGVAVRVPRGEIRFQDGFIGDLRALVSQGPVTIGEAISALGGEGRNALEIGRNLLFLVAAGALSPFAKTAVRPSGAGTRLANDMVARALAHLVKDGRRHAVPCETLGNGVPLQPIEALAITEWLAGADRVETLAARLQDASDRSGPAAQTGVSDPQRAAREVIEHLVPSFGRLGLIV